jgi:hypothetical protein
VLNDSTTVIVRVEVDVSWIGERGDSIAGISVLAMVGVCVFSIGMSTTFDT